MNKHELTLDAALVATGSKATYSGAGITIGGYLLSSEFAVAFGMLIGVIGLAVQWYYRHKLTNAEIAFREKEEVRKVEAHKAYMESLKK